jgi:hypothetical protein
MEVRGHNNLVSDIFGRRSGGSLVGPIGLTRVLLILALMVGTLTPLTATTASVAERPPLPEQLPPTGNPVIDNIYYGAVPPGGEQAPVLLFVHGVSGIASDWWSDRSLHGTNDMYDRAFNGGYRTAFVTLNLHGEPGPGNDMWTNGETLAQQISYVVNHYDVDTLDVVAHSKGGVDAQAAIVHFGAHVHVRNLFTLASPHWGSELADLLFSGTASPLADALEAPANAALRSLQTGAMVEFRAETDPIAATQDVRYYTGAGNSMGPPSSLLRLTGLYLARNYGPNDGFVTVASTELPGARLLFNQWYDHDSIRHGRNSFPWIQTILNEGSAATPMPSKPPVAERVGNTITRGGTLEDLTMTIVEFPIEDGASKVDLGVFISDPTVNVSVIAPSGQEHVFPGPPTEASGVFEGSWQVNHVIANPAGGMWKLKLVGPPGTAYLFLAEIESQLEVVVCGVPTGDVRPGQQVPFRVAVPGGKVKQSSNQLHRSGRGANARGRAVGRPQHAQTIQIPNEPGTFVLDLTVTGETETGVPFERTIVQSIVVSDDGSATFSVEGCDDTLSLPGRSNPNTGNRSGHGNSKQSPAPNGGSNSPVATSPSGGSDSSTPPEPPAPATIPSQSIPAPHNFTPAGPQGLGDRQDSWPWAMQWWQGHLYVGTNRAYRCVSEWSWRKFLRALIPNLAYLFPYPPKDFHLDCAEEPQDLPMQAEIWRWSPANSTWEMVYQSPNDVPNPDHPGWFVPRETGFRSIAVHVDPDGTEALYIGGITTRPMWDGPVPPPRILRTTNGTNWEPLPQEPGTFLGELDLASLRSLTSFNGQLFALAGPIQGNGFLIGSSNPAAGNDAWSQVSPEPLRFFELETFNGWLYAGTLDVTTGYSVLKTDAEGDAPYEFQPVVPPGAYLEEKPSRSVVSMHVHEGRLYVGTDNPAEIVRINPDDTWDLVIGTPRQTPHGMMYPLSGIDDGFGNQFNDHIWRMQSFGGGLYVGTYNSATNWKDIPLLGALLGHSMGFDLYRTSDNGWYFTPETMNGFGDPLSIGVRNFAATPYGLFVGAANDYHGLIIWRKGPNLPQRIPAPTRVEVEMHGGQPVLSWDAVPGAVGYEVQRAQLREINIPAIRLDWPPPPRPVASNLEEPTAQELQEGGFDISDSRNVKNAPGRFFTVAETAGTRFVDGTTAAGGKYLYVVVAKAPDGKLSQPSNLVQAPSLAPVVTFTSLLGTVDSLESKGLFLTPQGPDVARQFIQAAEAHAQGGGFGNAIQQLEELRTQAPYLVQASEATDLEVLAGKLVRRLQLVEENLINPATLH